MAEKEPNVKTPGTGPASTAQDAAPAPGEEKPDKKTKKAKPDAARLAALEEKAAAAEAERDAAKDQLLRTAAEYDNFRRRSSEEKNASFSNGVAHAAQALLPVLDTLEMAADAPTTDEEYKKGVILTLQKAQDVFKTLGIEEIDTTGQPFDPELHNACMNEPCEGVKSGHVSKVVQKGYTLNGRVIRHAVVAVAP